MKPAGSFTVGSDGQRTPNLSDEVMRRRAEKTAQLFINKEPTIPAAQEVDNAEE